MFGRPPLLPLALLAASLGCAGGAPQEAGGADLVAHRGSLRSRVLLTGELAAARSDDLSAPRTREFQLQIRWLAEDGAAVKAGDPIVAFDNSRFSTEIEEKRLAASSAADQLALKGAEGKTAGATQGFEVEKARVE